MTANFDYLKKEPDFAAFADIAVSAERIVLLDAAASIINCRRAMELAVKWMYSVDSSLEMPYQDTLHSLMNAEDYRELVGPDIWKRMDYIRKCANSAVHTGRKPGPDEAMLCLENLAVYMDFIACCYSRQYEEHVFDRNLIFRRKEQAQQVRAEAERNAAQLAQKELDLKALMEENALLKEALSARRQARQPAYTPKPLDLSEYETRKLYIDEMLRDAGWTEGKDWIEEVPLSGMPSQSGTGRADYILYDDMHKPLAVVEAKRTCEDVARGRQQAGLYADILEREYGRRPVVFLTNGFETRIIDGQYPERKCAAVYAQRDLEKWFNLRAARLSLQHVSVDADIAGRYYQEAAVRAVCDSFDKKNRRKALLVMATGSGKTRTVIALCKVLLDAGWIKNILFLADRNSLVTQAKRNFVNLLSDLSCTNLVEEKDNTTAHCVFSTYQTMIHCIDTVNDESGKVFTCGHFDLVICDEAHRSIYNKYKDIFTYFDAPLVGLTATPKDEIDKNTYEIFELDNGVPTYGYDLSQAVCDGYLVDYVSVESRLKFIEQGIVYDELSAQDKEAYEETFRDESGNIPEAIDSSALNTWIFNEDTIRQVLDILMQNGLKIDYGQKLGKTILFAKNHDHAEKILQVFHREYPHLPDFARVIDNRIAYAQSAIDEFSDAGKMPQIVISVDMLDTGIDIPEVLNLVFFKKVRSKAKFWQMIGRGTRICPTLIDGADKEKFYIFDFCGNFEFFRLSQGKATANMIALQGAVFNLKFELSYKLQDIAYQKDRLIAYRDMLVKQMCGKVRELPRDNFAVRQHLKYVDLYSVEESYQCLTFADTLTVKEEIAPLILPDAEEACAVRFDALMYGIELAYLSGGRYAKARGDLMKRVREVAGVANIPEIQAQTQLLDKLLNTDYLERAGIEEFEEIRIRLRELMKYLPKGHARYDTNFEDDLLSVTWNDAELENDEMENYKAKAAYYIRQHPDNIAIAKLRTNKPLTGQDVQALEEILWREVGTRQEYEREIGSKPLGEFVREIVGLDMNAAKEAFSAYLNSTSLDSRQIYFVNQIVEYIVHNGMMKDLSVLQEAPFTDRGSIAEIFSDMGVWTEIRQTIEEINTNAVA